MLYTFFNFSKWSPMLDPDHCSLDYKWSILAAWLLMQPVLTLLITVLYLLLSGPGFRSLFVYMPGKSRMLHKGWLSSHSTPHTTRWHHMTARGTTALWLRIDQKASKTHIFASNRQKLMKFRMIAINVCTYLLTTVFFLRFVFDFFEEKNYFFFL